jgi:hypothetical protein
MPHCTRLASISTTPTETLLLQIGMKAERVAEGVLLEHEMA